MIPGFQNKTLDVRTSNGLNDELLEPLFFVDVDGTEYMTPAGLNTDGGSTPTFIRNIPGFNAVGVNWFEYVQHDASYQKKLYAKVIDLTGGSIGERWVLANLTQKQSDDLLARAMKIRLRRIVATAPAVPWYQKPFTTSVTGLAYVRNGIIWGTLRLFGGFAYRKDREA